MAAGLVDGVLAGLGFGVLFAALGQVPDTAGLWPLTLCQAVSVPVVVLLATALRGPLGAARPRGAAGPAGRPLGAAATGLFLLATQRGFLTVAGVLASLYPASTVLLAALVLQGAGPPGPGRRPRAVRGRDRVRRGRLTAAAPAGSSAQVAAIAATTNRADRDKCGRA